jgi:hypothetical protein
MNAAVLEVVLVELTTLTVTPVPATDTVVAPFTKLVPVKVTLVVAAALPDTGLRDASVGGPSTAKFTEPLVPPAVVTVTPRFPVAAAGSIVNVAVRVVALTGLIELTEIPPPETAIVGGTARKFPPVRVTLTVCPWPPLTGVTVESVGVAGAFKFSVTGTVRGELTTSPEVMVIALV